MRRSSRPARLGLDIGGVLVDRALHDSPASFFGSRPLEARAVPGAIVELEPLVEQVFGGRVVLISKAGPRVEAATRAWLDHIGFHELTGVARQDLHFVRSRADKAPLCAALEVTHFVDDRTEVLDSLSTVDHRYLFTGGLGRTAPDVPGPGIRVARDWVELAGMLRHSS